MPTQSARHSPLAMLTKLNGIGPEIAAILWSEGLYRSFANRRQVAAYAGLAPTPWQSGSVAREQGVSKAGNPRLRTTVVIRDGEAALADLMPADATVPANREYMSQLITNLSWPADVGSINFYIRKGGEFRKWRTPDKPPPIELQPVEIRLRQMPAQGRAKLFATSPTWQTLRADPIFLDWSNLPVDSRSFEEIAQELKPRPVVPKRVTALTHPDIWQGAQTFKTISEILQAFSIDKQVSLDELGAALRRKYRIGVNRPGAAQLVFEYFQAVDYDGNVPASRTEYRCEIRRCSQSRLRLHPQCVCRQAREAAIQPADDARDLGIRPLPEAVAG
jgi:Transposase IS116/IS110/IS902 family